MCVCYIYALPRFTFFSFFFFFAYLEARQIVIEIGFCFCFKETTEQKNKKSAIKRLKDRERIGLLFFFGRQESEKVLKPQKNKKSKK